MIPVTSLNKISIIATISEIIKMWGQLIREEISLKRTLYYGLEHKFRRSDTLTEVELVMLMGISFKDSMTICT